MSAAQSISEILPFTLEVLKGPHAGEKFDFTKTTITIGREAENDVVLAKDPRISRQHLEIKQSMGQFYLVNLSQKNFVLVNGQNVASEKLEGRSVLQIGDSEIRFTYQGGTQALEPLGPVIPPTPPVATLPSRPMAPVGGGTAPTPYQKPPMPGPYAPPRPQAGPRPAGLPPRGPTQPSPLQKVTSHKMFALILVLGFIGVAFMLSNVGKTSKKVEHRPFRTEEELQVSRDESENEIKAFQERQSQMNTQIYQKAHENFLRGYRDYRQGQFARARESFQLVLNLDPDNDLARRYLNLSKIRFDEMVKFQMLQGKRYLEKKNFRMCRASYQSVMTMLGNDPSNPEYREALRLHRQCSLALETRY